MFMLLTFTESLVFQRKNPSASKEPDHVGDREMRDIAGQIMVGNTVWLLRGSLLCLTCRPVYGRCWTWACPSCPISILHWPPASHTSRERWRTAGCVSRRISGKRAKDSRTAQVALNTYAFISTGFHWAVFFCYALHSKFRKTPNKLHTHTHTISILINL